MEKDAVSCLYYKSDCPLTIFEHATAIGAAGVVGTTAPQGKQLVVCACAPRRRTHNRPCALDPALCPCAVMAQHPDLQLRVRVGRAAPSSGKFPEQLQRALHKAARLVLSGARELPGLSQCIAVPVSGPGKVGHYVVSAYLQRGRANCGGVELGTTHPCSSICWGERPSCVTRIAGSSFITSWNTCQGSAKVYCPWMMAAERSADAASCKNRALEPLLLY